MDIWQIDRLVIFVAAVLPGFVSLVVFESLIPSAKRDFSKSLIEIICFSTINFIALLPFIFIIFKCELYKNFTLGFYIFLLLIFIIAPTLSS